jgi:hypothetical protein
MPVDERSRHALYIKLEGILGREEATTLMEHLPPVGWADVATKRDLDELEQRVLLRLEGMEHSLTAQFRGDLVTQTRTFFLGMIGMFLTAAGVAVAAATTL